MAGQVARAEALEGRLVVAVRTSHAIADENPELVAGLTADVIAATRSGLLGDAGGESSCLTHWCKRK